MSESVEQAAPRIDWTGRARREAAAIIAEAQPNTALEGYETLVSLVAIGWLQGVSFGEHRSLALVDDSFDELRAAL